MADTIGAELAQLAREIWAWQHATFGDGCTVHGAVTKIRDECAEALAEYESVQHLRFESTASREALSSLRPLATEQADQFFMLVQLSAALNLDGLLVSALHHSVYARAAVHLLSAHGYPQLIDRMNARAIMTAQHAPFDLSADMPEDPPEVANDLTRTLALWMVATMACNCWPGIVAAIRAKLEVNKARTWAKPATDGTISHVKGGEA